MSEVCKKAAAGHPVDADEWFPMPGFTGWYEICREGEERKELAVVKDFEIIGSDKVLTMVFFPERAHLHRYPLPGIRLQFLDSENLLWRGPLPEFRQLKMG